MATKAYFVSTVDPSRKYEVVGFDKDKNEMRLKTADGVEFDFPDATKENITKAGYTMERVEVADV